jgi:ferric-dicitrate binding protein FerR (iron transport regulator)
MSQNHPDIDHLISLYLSGRASQRERQELEQWISASPANRKVFKHLREIWAMPSPDEYRGDMDQVRDRIWAAGTGKQQKVKAQVRRTTDILYWSKVAAVFLLFITGAWLFSHIVQDNTAVPETVALVEKVNPAGQRSSHRLPDGTRVWLNAESSLVYPEKFTDTLRLVELRGEAFFEVAKDQQRPFIVEAAETRTEALGTAFNIQAYPEGSIIKVALLEGKVRVQSKGQVQTAVLSPGEELFAPKDNAPFHRQPFKYDHTFGWKEGILIFDGSDFENFRSTIEKWYGVKVEVKGTAPDDWDIRARYRRESLQHVLRDICFNKNIKFELNDKNVLLTF